RKLEDDNTKRSYKYAAENEGYVVEGIEEGKSESQKREEKKTKHAEHSNDDIKLFSDDDLDFCRNRTAAYKNESHEREDEKKANLEERSNNHEIKLFTDYDDDFELSSYRRAAYQRKYRDEKKLEFFSKMVRNF
ncbi:hypothetical protein TNCV_251291, partial [Trichonephila clavipes]